ncbi:MAG: hypothetical protein ACKV0T_31125 [Planctomycetales bacterium]
MKLVSLRVKDTDADWSLRELTFFPGLTLLVGVSGAGKTRILNEIRRLRHVALGDDDLRPWGLEWDLRFHSTDGTEFFWSGKFEEREQLSDVLDEIIGPLYETDDDASPRPQIVAEQLALNGQLIRTLFRWQTENPNHNELAAPHRPCAGGSYD